MIGAAVPTMIQSQRIGNVRMWLRVAVSPQSIFVILRAGGLLLVALGIISFSLTIHYTSEQLRTMMESKPMWASSLHIWFPAPGSFRAGGIIAAVFGIGMMLLSAIGRRAR